jgi:plasmid stabilization system protein ParE
LSIESVRIHPAALEEAEAAMDWYAHRSRRAAEMFLIELDRAIEQIARDPERSAADEAGTRRMLLRRFPFLIIYRKVNAGVEIIAVAHGRRRPQYWRERLGRRGGSE